MTNRKVSLFPDVHPSPNPCFLLPILNKRSIVKISGVIAAETCCTTVLWQIIIKRVNASEELNIKRIRLKLYQINKRYHLTLEQINNNSFVGIRGGIKEMVIFEKTKYNHQIYYQF